VVVGAVAQSTGPTRIKIAAGTVTADDTRAGLVGVWEPDADLGLPPGANHTIYLVDGLYINPFRNVALIGFWSATAATLTSTPFEIRQLATGNPAPELKATFTQIGWDKPMVTQLTWLTPDRFQERSIRQATRRAKPVHDVTAVHRAAVVDLLRGSWTTPGGATVTFGPDGTYLGDAASLAARALPAGPPAPSRVRWTSRDVVTIDGEQLTRQSKQPDASSSPPTTGRAFLGVATPMNSDPIVSVVQAGSPAERAGLRVGDLIETVNGKNILTGAELVQAVQSLAPGTDIVLRVIRDGMRFEQRITLGSVPP
jgi:hypothetical protein